MRGVVTDKSLAVIRPLFESDRSMSGRELFEAGTTPYNKVTGVIHRMLLQDVLILDRTRSIEGSGVTRYRLSDEARRELSNRLPVSASE